METARKKMVCGSQL